MSEFFQYLGEWLKAFFTNIGLWFFDRFAYPWNRVPSEFQNYKDIFDQYSARFGVGGWIFFVLWWIFFAAVIFGICFGLFVLIRKYVRFCKKEIDKEKLQEQVERLNYELYQAVQEKDKILNLKVGSLGLPINQIDKKDDETIKTITSRFPKLTAVDLEYATKDVTIPEVPGLTLEEICVRFRNFCCSQLKLYYSIDTIRDMFAGMATSKLIILEGISGTGKTSMPYALGKFFVNDAEICSIQPSFKDRSELIGYYNEFTKKFNETEFLRALYEATYRKDPCIIVLDELNLARIEYYFAEFLSIMEMPNIKEWNIEMINNVDSNDPKHFNKGKLLIPQNVFFFGTANNDDSTFTISDKVYDRASNIFFENKGQAFKAEYTDSMKVSYDQINALFENAVSEFALSDKILDKFNELDSFIISKFRLAFGNRIIKQLRTFVPVYVACGGREIDGFDYILTNKVLKKFESLNIAFLKDELKQLNIELDKLFGKQNFQLAHKYINNLLKLS
ncbi:MAG: AAA family ATPase [Erysipelotrichaceae bacterium]|jgi:hypothetical protein|nr:AAA family ATPase [Erysipelotrichaceae bacterium]MCB9500201.1 AAA family ATPase [Erysipelotrichaceae bacterium]